MTINRFLIREFIRKVKWATASNICYLLTGKNEPREHNMVHVELNRMTKTKKLEIRLTKLSHEYYSVYKLATEKLSHINRQHPLHDIRLRDCLGKLFHGKPIDSLAIDKNADAKSANLYFEMDNGNMTKEQWKEKIEKNYRGKGKFQVIFWMATAEFAHWKTRENIKRLEQNRLNMLFDILKETMREKPNRILGAGYTQYLEDGKLFNMKGEEK